MKLLKRPGKEKLLPLSLWCKYLECDNVYVTCLTSAVMVITTSPILLIYICVNIPGEIYVLISSLVSIISTVLCEIHVWQAGALWDSAPVVPMKLKQLIEGKCILHGFNTKKYFQKEGTCRKRWSIPLPLSSSSSASFFLLPPSSFLTISWFSGLEMYWSTNLVYWLAAVLRVQWLKCSLCTLAFCFKAINLA